MTACKIIVHGLVQGVFYRQSAQEKATSLGIRGTVRNTEDGTVEIIAEGNENAIQQLIKWCHAGPRKAQVSKVDVIETSAAGYANFAILR